MRGRRWHDLDERTACGNDERGFRCRECVHGTDGSFYCPIVDKERNGERAACCCKGARKVDAA